MEAQLAGLQAKRKLLERARALVTAAQDPCMEQLARSAAADTAPIIDESRLLQGRRGHAEEERKPSRGRSTTTREAMANVVPPVGDQRASLRVDPQRSRTELAALRQMVNKTLQELRASSSSCGDDP